MKTLTSFLLLLSTAGFSQTDFIQESGFDCNSSNWPAGLNKWQEVYSSANDGLPFGMSTNTTVLIDLSTSEFATLSRFSLPEENTRRKISFHVPPVSYNSIGTSTMSVSECPGNFTEEATCVFNFENISSVEFSTIPGDSESLFCILDPSKTYYINFALAEDPYNQNSTCASEGETNCAIFFSESPGSGIVDYNFEHVQLVEVSLETFTMTELGPEIQNFGGTYVEDKAINEQNGIYWLLNTYLEQKMMAIDVETGDTTISFETNNLSHLQFDNDQGTFLGLQKLPATNEVSLVSVDQETGTTNEVVSNISNNGLFSGGLSSFNENDRVFYFLSAQENGSVLLNSVDIEMITHSGVVLPLNQGEFINHMLYDNDNDELFGLLKTKSPIDATRYYLVNINPSTGVINTLGPGTTQAYGNGSATLVEDQYYVYAYNNPYTGGSFITILDLHTGHEVQSGLVLPLDQGKLSNIHYDELRDKLFALYWY